MNAAVALLQALFATTLAVTPVDGPIPRVGSGKIVHVDSFPSVHVPRRALDIWVPADYPAAAPYAVLYMHDGQMLFDAGLTWYRQEWRADEVAGKLIAGGTVRPFIIVGIANGGAARHSEYFPQQPFEALTPAQQEVVRAAARWRAGAVLARGLQLYVNKDATTANTAVNLYPTGLSVSGDFKLRFDLWMNYPSTGNTTEHALFGINHSGTFANRVANAAGSDGLFFAMSGEGGSSGTSTTARDYSVFRGQGAGLAPLLLRTNNFTFGPNPGIGNSFDNADPLAISTFPSGSHPYGFSGVPGMRWVEGEVRQETVDGSPLITWMLNGVVFAQYTNATAYTSGNILIGYNDIFTSISPVDNYVVFDNIVVSTVPEPTMAVLAGMGVVAMIGYIRRRRN